MYIEVALLDAAEARSSDNDFSAVKRDKDGNVVIHNSRFKTRVRASEKVRLYINCIAIYFFFTHKCTLQTKIVMLDDNNREHHGQAVGVKGKQTTVKLFKNAGSRPIHKIQVLGKGELNSAERARDEFVLHVLQGKRLLKESKFIRSLWLLEAKQPNPCKKVKGSLITGRLNKSQADVVQAMTGTDVPIITVHGMKPF